MLNLTLSNTTSSSHRSVQSAHTPDTLQGILQNLDIEHVQWDNILIIHPTPPVPALIPDNPVNIVPYDIVHHDLYDDWSTDSDNTTIASSINIDELEEPNLEHDQVLINVDFQDL